MRMAKVVPAKNIYLVSNGENYFNVLNQIKEIYPSVKREQIITEPKSLNTAPAIALGMKYLVDVMKIKKDAPVIINPADHYIGKPEIYIKIVKSALKKIGNNLGTIGITPTAPETGFGYIKKGKKLGSYWKLDSFKEKPDRKTAEQYLASGEYVWNSGMYLFSEKTFASELKKHSPRLYADYAKKYDDFINSFEKMESEAIDTAISEKSKIGIVFEGDFGWSDIGSFDALAEIKKQSKKEKAKQLFFDSKNVYAYSSSNKLIAALGVEDLMIVENNDCILVQRRGKSEEVKKVVNFLKENNYREVEHNMVGYRPWGNYEVLIDDNNHKVKKITVFPGASLSLQSHEKRSEHWVVVKGTARVVNGENLLVLHQNESTYIQAGAKHQLSNEEKENLEIIEVQTGAYLGEDDIIRYKDEYGRPSGISA